MGLDQQTNPVKVISPSRDELLQTIGTVAKQARKTQELLQSDVSELIGVSYRYYGYLEQGRRMPSVTLLYRLCKALQIRPNVLLGFEPLDPDTLTTDPLVHMSKEDRAFRRLAQSLRRTTPQIQQAVLTVMSALDKA